MMKSQVTNYPVWSVANEVCKLTKLGRKPTAEQEDGSSQQLGKGAEAIVQSDVLPKAAGDLQGNY